MKKTWWISKLINGGAMVFEWTFCFLLVAFSVFYLEKEEAKRELGGEKNERTVA